MLLRPSGVLGRRRGVPNIVHARRCGPAATQQQSRCNSGGFASRKAIIAMLRRAPPGRPVRRRWPAAPGARLGACPGSAAAGDGQARPGRRRPPRAIEALPVAMSLPGTSSGLPARPAAPGELAVPISSSTAPAAAGDHHGHRVGRDRPGTKGEGISNTPRRQRPGALQYLVRQRDQQLLVRHALDVTGRPGPSRRGPWPRLSLVPAPGGRQGLQHPVSSRYRSAARPLPPLVSDPVCPAAPGALPGGVPGISRCRGWPGLPWTAPATPGHRGAARGHVSP